VGHDAQPMDIHLIQQLTAATFYAHNKVEVDNIRELMIQRAKIPEWDMTVTVPLDLRSGMADYLRFEGCYVEYKLGYSDPARLYVSWRKFNPNTVFTKAIQ
jgi:hypothetical protein